MRTILKGKFLLDTNTLIYAFDRTSPFHEKAVKIINLALEGNFEAFIAQQNLVEFSNVLIRDYKVQSFSVVEDIKNISLEFPIITPTPNTLNIFSDLLLNSKIKGYIFDLYLIATMLDNEVTGIITLNDKDFLGIKGINVVNPFK